MSEYNLILLDSTISSLIIVFSSIILSTLFCYLLMVVYTVSDLFYAILKIIFTIILSVPATAILLIFIFWFGNSDGAKMFFITLIAISYMFVAVIEKTHEKEEKSIYTLTMLGWSKYKIAFQYMMPISTPFILKAAGNASMLMWTYLVLSESIQTTSGLGFLLNYSLNIGKIDLFLLALFIIVTISIITKYFTYVLQKYFNKKWKLERC